MPIDRGIIDQQLQAIGAGSRWWEYREFRDLPAVLHADEKILALARGKLGRVRVLRRTWLIVVSDQRLLCIRSGGLGVLGGWRQLEIRVGIIERVSLRVGLFKGRLIVTAAGRKYRLLLRRPDAYHLASVLSGLARPRPQLESVVGPTLMARRVIDHVLALPAAAFSPEATSKSAPAPSENTVDEQRIVLLEEQVQQLQEQVEFLEDLLRRRHEADAAVIPELPAAAGADAPSSGDRTAG